MTDRSLGACLYCHIELEVLDMYTVFTPARPPLTLSNEIGHPATGAVRDMRHVCSACWDERMPAPAIVLDEARKVDA